MPAHCYTWSFSPKTDWSATYASSAEIRQYFEDFCFQHNLQKDISLQHKVIGARWIESEAQWHVQVDDLSSKSTKYIQAHVLINSTGILNDWQWPSIEGLNRFQGKLLHSACWDSSSDLSGQNVGLIGNGSSGIQILPAIQPHALQLFHFIRQPTWIAPVVHAEYQQYTRAEKDRFADDKAHHLQVRKQIEQRMNSTFETFHRDSPMQRKATQGVQASMIARLGGNGEFTASLLPQFPFGCRRPTPGTGYLEALRKDNVSTVMGDIVRVTPTGIAVRSRKASNQEHHYTLDALICATGFNTSFRPRITIEGRSGQTLAEAWKDEPHAYLGTAIPDFPNYFSILGPNCPVGNGPVLISIEAQVSYIVQLLSKFQKENIRSFSVKDDATRTCNEWKDEYMKRTVWTHDCRNWYKAGSNNGKIVALWPGSTLHYLELMKIPRYEDWEWEYEEGVNRWSFLGNGHSSAEKRPGGDLSWYIKQEDDSAIDPCLQTLGGTT